MRTDLVAGGLLLLIAGVFFVDRDYEGQSSSIFPNLVLLVLVVLGIAIIVGGIRHGDRERRPRQVNGRRLAAACVLLVVWGLLTGMIGFTISGVIAFVIATLMVRGVRPTPRTLVTDVAVGVVVVVGCFFIFTGVLFVPLPVSPLIGM